MLDPQRIGLNAASVGFLARTGQKVDWASFNQALQTDDSRVADVRATVETPVDELHVMGGQRFGLEGNSNLKMNARQERQMNGYPLRSFSAEAPSIILPDKYGGLPMYTRNQTEYKDFVSSFTAPLSGVLQNDTVLLGRQGYSVTNESASQPYRDVGFEHNMHKSKSAIDYNTALINQRRWLQIQSREAQHQKFGKEVSKRRAMGQKDVGGIVIPADNSNRGMGDGVFIGADGRPMTQVLDEANGDQFAGAVLENPQANPQVEYHFSSQIDPNNISEDSLEYNSSRRASRITADDVLHPGSYMQQRFNIGRIDRAGRLINYQHGRVEGNMLARGFAAFRRNYDSQSVEGRAGRRIFDTAQRDQVLFSDRDANTVLANDFNPLRSQRSIVGSQSFFIPSGNQARSLISGGGAASSPDFVPPIVQQRRSGRPKAPAKHFSPTLSPGGQHYEQRGRSRERGSSRRSRRGNTSRNRSRGDLTDW